ncbi:YfcC family protein [Georgenia subflava]|uniref:YfcC family protein n=1 Tax=Georgenia subflava TaxID=1622177 RepID=A0A6N7EPI7_9MICO|nr:Na+/H+ antiporter NhaC family protein [Georgenia subflava]MPV38425.1 YfcC family protein [Georgenia subflava]
MSAVEADVDRDAPAKKSFQFPGAVTVLAVVMVLVWVAALLIPAGTYQTDADGAPIAGSYERVDSPLTFGERVQQLLLAPVNGVYGVQDLDTGFIDTENLGALFGSIGVVVFILALGAFISVSFATRSLEVAVGQLAARLGDRGWLLIVVVMALFSLLGSTMGFSVETFGFYALLVPLMLALGYDKMVAAGMIILGALIGAMASTVNPFSIGVASDEAGISIGDGIVLRVILWLLLTTLAILYVLRYARRVRRDPSRSLVGLDPADAAPPAGPVITERLTSAQKWVLVITGVTFGLLIFSVIPWSAILGATAGPAEYDQVHETAAEPYWFELGWWFPQLVVLFLVATIAVGLVSRMGEKRLVSLVTQGMGDMMGPAIVIVLARGVAVIMSNTQTLDTVLNAMEQAVSGASAGVFAVLVSVVNAPLAFLIPSSSGHATLAMPLLAPLSDFAGVSRALTITAYQMGHGFMLLVSPTNVVVVGGLAIAGVGYDKYLRFVAPFLGVVAVAVAVVLVLAATVG